VRPQARDDRALGTDTSSVRYIPEVSAAENQSSSGCSDLYGQLKSVNAFPLALRPWPRINPD
jgi:hypothetical protein